MNFDVRIREYSIDILKLENLQRVSLSKFIGW